MAGERQPATAKPKAVRLKLIAIMPVRNEDWVLGLSARVALMWCDELMILIHASEDRTAAIASGLTCEFPGRCWVSFEQAPEWNEMAHRQHLLADARQRGATHIAIVDADELLAGNLLASIREHVERLSPGYILRLPGYNLRGSLSRYHSNGVWGNRMFSLAFKDDGRANWQGDQFHHREPFGVANVSYEPVRQGLGGVMHLWGADERRLIAKHALYKMTERLRWPSKPAREIDAYYNYAIRESASNGTQFACHWAYAVAPATWWEPYRDLMAYLSLSAPPWQETEARRLWLEHGAQRFIGLDLFNVITAPAAA